MARSSTNPDPRHRRACQQCVCVQRSTSASGDEVRHVQIHVQHSTAAAHYSRAITQKSRRSRQKEERLERELSASKPSACRCRKHNNNNARLFAIRPSVASTTALHCADPRETAPTTHSASIHKPAHAHNDHSLRRRRRTEQLADRATRKHEPALRSVYRIAINKCYHLMDDHLSRSKFEMAQES